MAAGGKGDKPPKADLMLGVCQLDTWQSDLTTPDTLPGAADFLIGLGASKNREKSVLGALGGRKSSSDCTASGPQVGCGVAAAWIFGPGSRD